MENECLQEQSMQGEAENCIRKIEDEIEVLQHQQRQEDTYQDDRKCYMNRYQNHMEEAGKYYRGREASLQFSNINQTIKEQRNIIVKESNANFKEREEKMAQLRRMREEA